MAISLVQVANGSSVNSSSIAVTGPSGSGPGDLLVVFVVQNTNTATFTPPSGWSQLDSQTDATTDLVQSMVYQMQAGESSSTTWTITSSALAAHNYGLFHIRGHDPNNPVNCHGSTSSTTSNTSSSTPLMSPTANGNALMCAVYWSSGSFTGTPPSGATEQWDNAWQTGKEWQGNTELITISGLAVIGTRTETLSSSSTRKGASAVVISEAPPPTPAGQSIFVVRQAAIRASNW